MIKGLYYFARKCKFCGMLIWGESEKSEAEAQKDFNRKINAHYDQEHSHAHTRQKEKSRV